MSKFKAIFGGGGGSINLPPPVPVPTREDPSIAAARQEIRQAAKRRVGRASTVVAGQGGGALGDTVINRPGLRQAQLLGG